MESINSLFLERSKIENNYKRSINDNDEAIENYVKASDAYKNLAIECTGNYKCWVYVYEKYFTVSIAYKLTDILRKQSVSICENEINLNKIVGLSEDLVEERLKMLAENFKKEFWNKD